MAVTAQKSDQLTNVDAIPPVYMEQADKGGAVFYEYFTFTQSGAGDATSTVELCRLPAGRIRILRSASVLASSAFGSSRVLDVGTAAYTDLAGAAVAAAPEALKADIDVASATTTILSAGTAGSDPTLGLVSKTGVSIIATVAGGTIPNAATLKGYIAYIKA